MIRRLITLVALMALFTAPTALAQDPVAKSMLKHPIDRALANLFQTVGADQITASRTPVLHAARYLVASTFCHRQYTEHDGPIIRSFRQIIIRHRSSEGGFYGKRSRDRKLATAWAVQALTSLDPQAYGPTIRLAMGFLRKDGATKISLPFDQLVNQYARELSGSTTAERKGKLHGWIKQLTAGQKKDGSWPGTAETPYEKTLDHLIRLVALQQIALGKQEVSPADSLPAWMEKGMAYLLSRQTEGKWNLAGGPHIGITALCLSSILTKPAARRSDKEKEVIDQATSFLLENQQENGSFSNAGTPVYITSVVIHALLKTRREELKPKIKHAMRYLLRMQNVDGRGYTPGDRDYGSLGYGGDNRGDMSNLQLALDALRSAGLPGEDEALEKALVFIQRSQNRSSTNDYQGVKKDQGKEKPVVSGNDGGGIYYPGKTNAGYRKVGNTLVPRAYGSMTWALLKCYILCNVKQDNPRVKDAWKWIQENYTLQENPGFSPELKQKNAHYQGLFYYYLTMARTLALLKVESINVVAMETAAEMNARQALNSRIAADPKDKRKPVKAIKTTNNPDGSKNTWVYKKRYWRQEMLAQLKGQQQANGSWANQKASRWMEGNPDLATAYALLTAAYALNHPSTLKID